MKTFGTNIVQRLDDGIYWFTRVEAWIRVAREFIEHPSAQDHVKRDGVWLTFTLADGDWVYQIMSEREESFSASFVRFERRAS